MPLFRLGELEPVLGPQAWVAPSAQLIGRVELGAQASVWDGATVRADNDLIRIGAGSNVQEACVLHTDPGLVLDIGEGVTIGHQVVLHGCTVGDGSLVGIQSVVLNRARIGRSCLVGAGSLVTEGKVFPDGVLLMGRPAKVVRELTDEERARLLASAQLYVRQAQRHAAQRLQVG